MLVNILLVRYKFVLKLLFEIDAFGSGLRQTVYGVHHEMKAIQLIQHGHVEGCGDGAFFLVAPDVDVAVIGAAISQPVDQPWVGMEGKDDRLVLREEVVKISVAQTMRMLAFWLQPHEVNNID